MDYLTIDEVAGLLKVSPRTVARWAADDVTFPATRVGRTVRVESSALDTWLRSKTQSKSARRSATPVSVA